MKPYGKFYPADGCTCSLCRSRGYRKGYGYDPPSGDEGGSKLCIMTRMKRPRLNRL